MIKKNTIDNLLYLRVFALSMVVLRHSFAPFNGAWNLSNEFEQNSIISIIGIYISSISMPLYVFISGLLFSFLRNHLKKYPSFKVLFNKKIKRLIVPYIFFAPIYIYFFLETKGVKEFIIEFWSGAGHLWFLTMIFVVFTIFYRFENFFQRKPIVSFIIILTFFIPFPIYNYLRLGPIAQALYYFPFFYIGYFFYLKGDLILQRLRKYTSLLFMIHAVIFTLTIFVSNQIENYTYESIFYGLMKLPLGLLSVTIIYLLFSNSKNIGGTFDNILKNISEKSYYIYIFHQPLMILFFNLEEVNGLNTLLIIILGFITGLFISLLFANFTMYFSFGRKLIGTR